MSHNEIDEPIELRNALNQCLQSFKSAYELLSANESMLSNDNHEVDINLKKSYILDSFNVNKTIKSYKQWQQSKTERFISDDITKYNSTSSEVNKLNDNYYQSILDKEKLTNSIQTPSFQFSYQSLKKLNDEDLLSRIAPHEDDDLIDINQLFSVSDKSLPFPDYSVIEQLVTIEFSLRVEKRLQYELCQAIKHQIVLNNSKWTNRSDTIDDFLSKKLTNIINDVTGIMEEFETIEPEYDDDDEDIEQELEEELENESEDIQADDQEDEDEDQEDENEEQDENDDQDENEPENGQQDDEDIQQGEAGQEDEENQENTHLEPENIDDNQEMHIDEIDYDSSSKLLTHSLNQSDDEMDENE